MFNPRGYVAPFAGAWIEIQTSASVVSLHKVAPFAGAWIEMDVTYKPFIIERSLPSRERGLKCH